MRILLTGKKGQLGWELNRTLSTLGTVFALGRNEMDLFKPETLDSAIQDIQPDIIINAAAYTAADRESRSPNSAPN